MLGVVPQHGFHSCEFAQSFLLLFLADCVLLLLALLPGSDLISVIHNPISSGLLEKDSKGLARAMELSSNRIGRLFSQCCHLFIAQLLVGDQKQQ